MALSAAMRARQLADRIVLALTIWAEARNQPRQGQIAVALVIQNRARLRRQTITQVCLAPSQFSCWNAPSGPGDKNAVALASLVEVLVQGGAPTDRSYRQALQIADEVLGGQCRDFTFGADHYLRTDLLHSPKCPGWARTMVQAGGVAGEYGDHTFLRSAGSLPA